MDKPKEKVNLVIDNTLEISNRIEFWCDEPALVQSLSQFGRVEIYVNEPQRFSLYINRLFDTSEVKEYIKSLVVNKAK